MNKIQSLLFAFMMSSCIFTEKAPEDSYESIGTYKSRAAAENMALKLLVQAKSSIYLSKKRILQYNFYYKAKTGDSSQTRAAIHYDVLIQNLCVESDPGSGCAATWDSVSIQTIKNVVQLNGDLRDINKIRKSRYDTFNMLDFYAY